MSTAFAQVLGLDTADQHAVFHTALLRAVGCTSYASENSALFVDDTAFQAALKAIDPGDPAVFGAQMAKFGDWAGPQSQPALAQRFLDIAATEGVRATGSACEVSRALGPRLGLPAAAVDALDHVLERWDGLGMPGRCSGEDLPLIVRVVHLGEQAVWAHAHGGRTGAVAEVRRRSGGHLDDLYDPSVRLHGYTPDVLDRTEVAHFYAAIFAAFPGCSLTQHETFAGGDRLVCRFTLAGRHDGPFLGVPATGHDITLPGITILHFREGRCVERWSCADMLGVLVQVGAVPPPA